jgi:hypothetical protein
MVVQPLQNLGKQDINTAGSRFIYGRERRAIEGR